MKVMQRVLLALQKMFNAPSLDEVMEHEALKAALEERQCQHVIHTHRFQQHMARARLDAIEKWRAQERLLAAPQVRRSTHIPSERMPLRS